MKNKNITNNQKRFQEIAKTLNLLSFEDYFNRLQKVALSLFEWVNLPDSMNAMALEKALFFYGQASLLYDEQKGYINTNCASNGYVNIYGLPTKLNCYAYDYRTDRILYTGIKDKTNCILVQNNWERIPTASTLELFAQRLANIERTIDVNINAQRTPMLILINENQRGSLENLYNKYEGNIPVIFGDKDSLDEKALRSIETGAPYISNKLFEAKKEIWNEALTFLGINNIMVDKKERLITDEANSNNELINLNLQSYLAPRELACKQFNDLFGFTGTEKEISVRVRSDLHNIIKNAQSIINDYKVINDVDDKINDKTEGLT